MGHELNELEENVFSFADARSDAWHRLGTQVGHTMTATEALDAAHLANWNVRKVELKAQDDLTTGLLDVDNRWATIYTNPLTGQSQYLGTVGSHYDPIQNEKNADLLNAITTESGAHFETAGSLRGGRQTFITMKMPETMMVGGADAVDMYLVALNSHDGNGAFKFLITPVRVVCANTQAAALGAAKASFSIRHVRGATGHIQEAREALGLTFKYVEAFEAEAEKMLAKPLRDAAFFKATARLFNGDIAATARQKKTALAHVNGVRQVWEDSPTMEGIKGTRWGGYQAITEYADHFMSVRNTGKSDATSRAFRSVTSKEMSSLKEASFATFSKTVLA